MEETDEARARLQHAIAERIREVSEGAADAIAKLMVANVDLCVDVRWADASTMWAAVAAAARDDRIADAFAQVRAIVLAERRIGRDGDVRVPIWLRADGVCEDGDPFFEETVELDRALKRPHDGRLSTWKAWAHRLVAVLGGGA